MKWYAVVNKKTGEAVSFGTEVADPLSSELDVIELEHEPRNDEEWDSETKKMIKREPSPFLGKIARLQELRGKGWDNLSEDEKKEVKILIFDIEGGPAPE